MTCRNLFYNRVQQKLSFNMQIVLLQTQSTDSVFLSFISRNFLDQKCNYSHNFLQNHPFLISPFPSNTITYQPSQVSSVEFQPSHCSLQFPIISLNLLLILLDCPKLCILYFFPVFGFSMTLLSSHYDPHASAPYQSMAMGSNFSCLGFFLVAKNTLKLGFGSQLPIILMS